MINLELQSKEFILVLKLMRTEPQFWSKAYDPVECTVEPLEQSQDWHKVVTICEILCCCLLNHGTDFLLKAGSQKVFASSSKTCVKLNYTQFPIIGTSRIQTLLWSPSPPLTTPLP